MFFRAFGTDVGPALPNDLVFRVEYLTSQLLLGADRAQLQTLLFSGSLSDSILDELRFLGEVPPEHLPAIRAYLRQNESSLSRAAKLIAFQPENEAKLRELVEPLRTP